MFKSTQQSELLMLTGLKKHNINRLLGYNLLKFELHAQKLNENRI